MADRLVIARIGQFSLRSSSQKSRSDGSLAAASKARRSADMIPACAGCMSKRMIRRSMEFSSGTAASSLSTFIGIANDPKHAEVSSSREMQLKTGR